MYQKQAQKRDYALPQARSYQPPVKALGLNSCSGITDTTEFHYDVPAIHALLGTSLDAALTVDEQAVIVDLNPAAERMFGWSRQELLGTNISVIVPPPAEDMPLIHTTFDPVQSMTRVHDAGWRLYGQRRDGTRFPIDAAVTVFTQRGDRYFTGFVRDMTESLRHAEQMHYMATHDMHSGLLNYRGFVRKGSSGINSRARVVAFRLEEYRHFSITYGDAWCLRLLQELTERLHGFLRGGEIAARVHEDMFAILFPGRAVGRTDALAALLAEPFNQGSMCFGLTTTFGVSDSLGPIEDRLRGAQLACESANTNGSGRIVKFNDDLRRSLEREVKIESRLRQAIADGKLSLALQPKVSLKTHRIIGAEALVRWADAELGQIPPSDFIPIAERNGLVGGITDWVLQQSLQAIAQCDDTSLTIAVNFSALDFCQMDLVDRIDAALKQAALAPSRLVIEMTESVLAHDVAHVDRQMRKLKALGVMISLDDFGTGYSSLSYLRQFPIDALKIDRSFVRDLPNSKDTLAITASIVAMAKSLKLDTVAEGVETHGQRRIIESLGIDQYQGYLFSPPVPPAYFHRLLNQTNILQKSPAISLTPGHKEHAQ